MINNLRDFYSQVANPLENNNLINQLISDYAVDCDNALCLEQKLSQHYSKGSKSISMDDYNSFYSFIFNCWKHTITNISEEQAKKMMEEGILDTKFPLLQQYLKEIPNAHSRDEVDFYLTGSNAGEVSSILKKYCYTSDTIFDEWNHFSTYLSIKPSNLEHSLYMNIDSSYIHKFAKKFLEKCGENGLPVDFVISNHRNNRDNNFILYSDGEKLLDYYHTLKEIMEEDKDLLRHVKKPHILTGSIDNIIGYASVTNTKTPAYTKTRATALYCAVENTFQQVLFQHPKLKIEVEDEEISVPDEAAYRIVDKKLEYLESLSKKELYNYYGLKPRHLKRKKFIAKMHDAIEEAILQGLEEKTFDFKPVFFQYKKRGKFKTKYLEVSKEEIVSSLKTVLPDIVSEYPRFKKDLKENITIECKNANFDDKKFCFDTNWMSKIYKKDPDVASRKTNKTVDVKQDTSQPDYSRVYSSDDSCDIRQLRKEEIIQDLPIYSTLPTTFQGGMSEDEIRRSQEKINVKRSK